MAFSNILFDYSFPASADLSTKQHYFVSLNSAGNIAVTGAGADLVGVLQDKPSALGQSSQVRVLGISKVVAGGTILPGALVASTSTGTALTAVATNTVAGRALTNAASGELVSVLLTGPYKI
ncbi:hypothetical protein UFOVP978_21 [uncultured Caudovirales phage]|uniref:Bacteriophage VT1-Sakai, H0018 n=1 Tax=uncultured Caudovirales phage TaxID=2100421 RepID=A0A6J5PYS4_9CAUD|nr:hypothetical protein UFOVP978_21 [uncultured Caudovirales phage]